MKALIIEGTFMTPEVVLDPIKKEFALRGNSRPENPVAFFQPIFTWINDFFSTFKEEATFHICLEYFNTSTSKVLLDIFEYFEIANEKGAKVNIIWYYPADDEDMKDAGEELFDLVPVSGELKAI